LASDPYTAQPQAGVTVTFSDGNKGGTFNPASAITNSSGAVSTTYTLPKKAGIYTLTASAAHFGNAWATETATALAPAKIVNSGGGSQTAVAGSVLPNPVVAKVVDIYANPVSGVTVNFSANNGGITTPASAVTNAKGLASTSLQLPDTVGAIAVSETAYGLHKETVLEHSVAGPAASITVSAGNNQSAARGTTLPQALTVVVTDLYGNPVSGAAVAFSDGGAGGNFANSNPADSNSSGIATQTYTLPSSPGKVTITATVSGVPTPAAFTETAQ
jgi:adhesin/invasin